MPLDHPKWQCCTCVVTQISSSKWQARLKAYLSADTHIFFGWGEGCSRGIWTSAPSPWLHSWNKVKFDKNLWHELKKEANLLTPISETNNSENYTMNRMFPLDCHPPPPGPQQEEVWFWYQMKAHIFFIITTIFQLQIHYTLEVIAEKVLISSIPILIFSCIFITA